MSPQTALAFTETPQRVDQTWVVAMPKEIAEDLFGVPAGSLVTLFARSGEIAALMNLAAQTEEARRREPGWFLDMPADMAAAAGFAPGSLLTIYAKQGSLRVEVLPPSPELAAAVERSLSQHGEAFEELKRLGD